MNPAAIKNVIYKNKHSFIEKEKIGLYEIMHVFWSLLTILLAIDLLIKAKYLLHSRVDKR